MQQKIELLQSDKANFIALNKAKQYLRVSHNYDDELISDMLEVAVCEAENFIGKSLKKSTWKLNIFGEIPQRIRLNYGPVNKIERVKIIKNNGEEIYVSHQNYFLDFFKEALYLRRSYICDMAEIIYSTGYPQEHLPSSIKQGMLEHLAKLYDLRGTDHAMPLSAKSLYQSHKIMRF